MRANRGDQGSGGRSRRSRNRRGQRPQQGQEGPRQDQPRTDTGPRRQDGNGFRDTPAPRNEPNAPEREIPAEAQERAAEPRDLREQQYSEPESSGGVRSREPTQESPAWSEPAESTGDWRAPSSDTGPPQEPPRESSPFPDAPAQEHRDTEDSEYRATSVEAEAPAPKQPADGDLGATGTEDRQPR